MSETCTESFEHSEPRSSVRVIRISDSDLDRPLYRIFPLWFFEAALRDLGGSLVLVPPSRWDDPFEDPCMNMMMNFPDHSQTPLAKYLRPVYAQCWSFEGKSDALLRAYSRVIKDGATKRNVDPKYEGVQVKTTPRKIITALKTFLGEHRDDDLEFYLGAVQYVSDPAQVITNWLNQLGPQRIGRGDYRVASLLLKRKAFQHELEVRIILLGVNVGSDPSYLVGIKPNEVFDEVSFDSRLDYFEYDDREKRARELGYTGQFGDRTLYQSRIFEVHLSKNLDEYGK